MSTASAIICSYFQELAKNVPKALKFHNIWGKRFAGNPLREVWDIVIKEDMPKHTDIHSCGYCTSNFWSVSPATFHWNGLIHGVVAFVAKVIVLSYTSGQKESNMSGMVFVMNCHIFIYFSKLGWISSITMAFDFVHVLLLFVQLRHATSNFTSIFNS